MNATEKSSKTSASQIVLMQGRQKVIKGDFNAHRAMLSQFSEMICVRIPLVLPDCGVVYLHYIFQQHAIGA